MAQNITLWGASYSDVPAIDLPKTSGGTTRFIDEEEVVTYYTGTGDPPATLANGDIYLKVVST